MSAAYRIVSTTTTTQTNGSSRRMARGYPQGYDRAVGTSGTGPALKGSKLRTTSPVVTAGGPGETSARFSPTQAAAARTDSSAPAWSS